MDVKELIDKLKKIPGHYKVKYDAGTWQGDVDIVEIDTTRLEVELVDNAT